MGKRTSQINNSNAQYKDSCCWCCPDLEEKNRGNYEFINVLEENGDSIYALEENKKGQVYVLASEVRRIVREELTKAGVLKTK